MDAHNLSFEDRVFDMVVSTENLEHLRDAERNVAEIECCARTASSFSEPPNKEMFSPGLETCLNPFHVKECYFDELDSLLRRHFATVSIFENTLPRPFEAGRQCNSKDAQSTSSSCTTPTRSLPSPGCA